MDKKRYRTTIIVIGALAGIGPFTIDMYLPGFQQIARDLQTDMVHVGFTLTSYFIGISLGQLFLGPLLERYGRIKPLITGLILYTISAMGCFFSPSVYSLIVMRFFLALGVCVSMVGGQAIMRDLFSGRELARANSLVQMVFGVAPVIAPSLGGMVVSSIGWRYVFIILTFIAAVVVILIKLLLPETKGEDKNYSLHPRNVFASYFSVMKEKQFMIFIFASAATGGSLFSYITNSPFIFMDMLGFTSAQIGWIFGANALALVAGAQLNRIMLRKYDSINILLTVSVIQSSIIFLMLAGALTGYLPQTAVIISISGFLFCIGLIFPNSGALALQPLTKNIGNGSALMGSIQMLFSAVTSALVSYLNDGRTAIPMAAVMSACTILSLALLIAGSRVIPKNP